MDERQVPISFQGLRHEDNGVRDGPVDGLDEAGGLGVGTRREVKDGNLQDLTVVVAEGGDARRGGLESVGPVETLDAGLDEATVSRCGRVLGEKRLGNAAIDARAGREREGIEEVVGRHEAGRMAR